MRNARTKQGMPKLEMRSLDIPLYDGQQGGWRAKQSTRVLLAVIAVVVIGFGYFAATGHEGEPGCVQVNAQTGAAGGAHGQRETCNSRQGR